MFNCYNHAWSSLVSACPICFPIVFRYSSSTEIKLDQDTESTSEASNLQADSENPEIAKPQENCPTKNECADLYRDAVKAQKRIAELTAENELLKELDSKRLSHVENLELKVCRLESKLKLATDALETLQTEADDWHLRGITRETLAKLRGGE